MGFSKTCKQEIQLANCGCYHEAPDELVKSQWQSRSKSLAFLVYRLLLGAFYTTVVVWSMHSHVTVYAPLGYYFIYLTNWGIMLCALTTVLAASLVLAWHFHPELAVRGQGGQGGGSDEMPWIFKVYWGLHNSTLILSMMITILYWGIIYDEERDKVDAINILTHGTNSVFMFIDLIIVAHPLKLMHVAQPFALGLIYALFTLIYYLAEGKDGAGNPYIYEPLDWRNPGRALIFVLLAAVAVTILHFIMFWIYRLRMKVYKMLYPQKTLDIEVPRRSSEIVAGQENPAFVCVESENVEIK